MSDVKRMFEQDCKDKKNTARSAKNVRTHCGRRGAVKLPSDYMSKKEKEAMNGECKSYRMNEPVAWNEFKSWPKEHQESYIKLLKQKFNVSMTAISEMFGINRVTLSKYISSNELKIGEIKFGNYEWDKKGFYEWCTNGKKTTAQRDFDKEIKKMEETLAETFNNTFNGTISNEDLAELNRLTGEVNEAWNKTLGNYAPINAVLSEHGIDICQDETICDNEYHNMPVIPKNGTMVFENNYADDALATIKSILSNVEVKLTVTWEVVE